MPLAPLVWFKAGGAAQMAVRAQGCRRPVRFPARARSGGAVVMALGLGSNLIVRDGGVPGVVVRLGKPFAKVEALDATICAAAAVHRASSYPPPRATRASPGLSSFTHSGHGRRFVRMNGGGRRPRRPAIFWRMRCGAAQGEQACQCRAKALSLLAS